MDVLNTMLLYYIKYIISYVNEFCSYVNDLCSYVNNFFLYRYTINNLLKIKKVSGIGIGIGHFGIEYRRYSKQSIGIGIGIGHHGIVPSLIYR